MSLGYARSAQLRGTASISSGKTLTATGMETPFDVEKGELVFSCNDLPIETSRRNPVFVNQKSVMLSRTSSRVRPSACPSKTRAISS